MTDPREDVRFEGIGYVAFTYNHDDTIVYDITEEGNSAQVGLAVTLESSGVVSLVGDGEQVEGKLVKVEPGGVAVVQVGGVMTLPGGSGATLTPGSKIVGDLGAASAEGYVQSAAAATAANAVVSRGTIIDASVATAVVVRLEAIGN
jgi:hypothetical protein